MDFRDKDGGPLITWHDPSSAFEAWKRCSAGRPCDYTGLSHERLRSAPSGIQWPCDEKRPDGTERLYTDGIWWAHPDVCESYGKDLLTGAEISPVEYRPLNPGGKAMLRAAAYSPPHEEPDERYPFWLTTGRTLYHFHTRTKTGRVPQLNDAAPDVWVEVSRTDADAHDLAEGDLAEITSPRGTVRARVRVSALRPGVLFLPFHYGYWDLPDGAEGDAATRAANEATVTDWDPVSKQPIFKTCAARIRLVQRGDGTPAPAPTTTASSPHRYPRRPGHRRRSQRPRPQPYRRQAVRHLRRSPPVKG